MAQGSDSNDGDNANQVFIEEWLIAPPAKRDSVEKELQVSSDSVTDRTRRIIVQMLRHLEREL